MRSSEGAGRPLGGDRGTAGQTRDDNGIVVERDPDRKQASDSPCVKSVWARWRSAFRIAVHALRGPQ